MSQFSKKTVRLSINSLVSWALKLIIAVLVIALLFQQNVLLGGFATLMLSTSLIPAIVNRSYNVNLPWAIDFFLTLIVFLAVLGELGLYQRFPWWDNFLHLSGTVMVAYLAFVLIYALNFTGKIRLSIPLIGLLTLITAMALGVLWEMAEFWTWQLVGSDTLAMGSPPDFKEGLFDTFTDLHFDLAGAAIAAVGGMKYVARQRHVKLREWMRPFFGIFGSEGKKVHRQGQRIKDKGLRKI